MITAKTKTRINKDHSKIEAGEPIASSDSGCTCGTTSADELTRYRKMIHDREYFYKYMPAETAFKILQTRTLKYSSPIIFNDPFDTQTRMDFGFEVSELIEAFSEELYKMIHGPEEPVGDESNELFRDINKVWHVAKQSKR